MNNRNDPVREPDGHYRGGLDFSTLLIRIRSMRQESTSAESVLWEVLRNRRFLGVKFRRQHQFGVYILDFYSASERVAVELDGGIHQAPEQQAYDRVRDDFLRSNGVTVVRITNHQFFQYPEEALHTIRDAFHIPPPIFP